MFITTPRGATMRIRRPGCGKDDGDGGDAFAQILDATQTGVFTAERLELELQSYIAEFGEEYGRSKFEQEYLCSFDVANLGSILARSIGIAEREGRVTDDVEFDELGQPMHIFADIGRRDTSTWYFWQPQIGGYQIFDYDGGWGLDAEEWCDRLAEKISQYKLKGQKTPLAKIWLPHDARAKTFSPSGRRWRHSFSSLGLAMWQSRRSPASRIESMRPVC